MFNIISWNVNGIRAVEKKSFIPWLESTGADVVCIQETKANPSQLSEELLSPNGYKAYFSSAKKAGYSGTAIYSKTEPDSVFTLGIPEFDEFFLCVVLISSKNILHKLQGKNNLYEQICP